MEDAVDDHAVASDLLARQVLLGEGPHLRDAVVEVVPLLWASRWMLWMRPTLRPIVDQSHVELPAA